MHLFLGHCGLILQLVPIFDQLWGLNGRGKGGADRSIDLIEVLPAHAEKG